MINENFKRSQSWKLYLSKLKNKILKGGLTQVYTSTSSNIFFEILIAVDGTDLGEIDSLSTY